MVNWVHVRLKFLRLVYVNQSMSHGKFELHWVTLNWVWLNLTHMDQMGPFGLV